MRRLLSAYKWPLLAVLTWVVIALAQFGFEFLIGIWNKLHQKEWWVENTLSFVIFTILVSWVVTLVQKNREKLDQEPFTGWQVVLKGLQTSSKPQDIFWMDVQKNRASPFEKWKFIKSAVSSTCWINTPGIDEAEKRWLSYGVKKIIVDFSKMTETDTDLEKLSPLLMPKKTD